MVSQKAFIGKDSIAEMQDYIHTLSPRKVFLLRGKRSYEICGAKDIMEDVFRYEDLAVSEWCDFQDNPKLEDVEKGLRLLRESEADMIISVGGGSVLDMAKLIRFANSYNGELTGKDFEKTEELLPLIAIPTTSGTGCEATPFAVCYKNKFKYSVAHPDMLPDIAVVYPPFTYRNSPYLTACTGFDALAQATEAYWNVNATTESDRYAEEAISLLWKNINKAVNSPSDDVRDAMSIGAYLAGKAISITKTTAPHAFSYAFTTYCGYPHGHAVALTFPFFFYLNVCQYQDHLQEGIEETFYRIKMKTLLSIYNVEATKEGMKRLIDYIDKIGLNNNGYNDIEIQRLLSKVNIQRLENNPVILNEKIQNDLLLYLTRFFSDE